MYLENKKCVFLLDSKICQLLLQKNVCILFCGGTTMNYLKKNRFQSVQIAALSLYNIQRENLVFIKFLCIITASNRFALRKNGNLCEIMSLHIFGKTHKNRKKQNTFSLIEFMRKKIMNMYPTLRSRPMKKKIFCV